MEKNVYILFEYWDIIGYYANEEDAEADAAAIRKRYMMKAGFNPELVFVRERPLLTERKYG
jgi:hypothetical protein